MADKWYQNWFNSPYYHILYQNRNNQEAQYFIDNLAQHLQLAPGARVLDIACGRGRHSIYLNKKGYDVTGIDLSYSSIAHAQQFENEHLHFYRHDMRKLLHINYFEAAFNLFTSFGYFDTDKDHIDALVSFRKSLKAEGLLILDYFNIHKILKDLVPSESKTLSGIDFNIKKEIADGKIIKSISFKHEGEEHFYQEKVAAFRFADFEKLFSASGFKISRCFGDYSLAPYHADTSDRLILICTKAHV